MRLRRNLGIQDMAWMGDVYRVVAFVETFCQAFSYACPQEYPGQMAAWRAPRPAADLRGRTLDQVAALPFEEARLAPGFYRRRPLAEIRAEVLAARARLPR